MEKKETKREQQNRPQEMMGRLLSSNKSLNNTLKKLSSVIELLLGEEAEVRLSLKIKCIENKKSDEVFTKKYNRI